MGKFWGPYAKQKAGAVLTSKFREDGTTRHMDRTYGATQRPAKHPHHFLAEFARDCRTFQERVPREFWPLAREHPFGKPMTGKWQGMLASLTSLDYAYMVWRLHPWLEKATSVLEIGGGFGGLARTMIKYRPSLRVTLVDLAPIIKIQKYYLKMTHSFARVAVAGSEVPDGQFDVVVAARMMCELDLAEVGRHLAAVDKAIAGGGVFYCVHHLDCINKFKDWPLPRWGTLLDEQYPFSRRKNWREKIWRKPKGA